VDRSEHAERAVPTPDPGHRLARLRLSGVARDAGTRRTGVIGSRSSDGYLCANCGLAISWPPVRVDGNAYCCGGCALGGPCYCSYDRPEECEQPVGGGSAVPEAGAGSYDCVSPEKDARSRPASMWSPIERS
jgi:hypothetical protein